MPRHLTAGASPVKLDIAIFADIRVGDVAAPCHAAAARALAQDGYSIGIVPVLGGAIPADPYRMDPDFAALLDDGTARRIGPAATVDCTLALAFDARLFQAPLQGGPDIRADHRLVTIERPESFACCAPADLDRLRSRAETALGGAVLWCPTSITARDALSFAAPHWPDSDTDWTPVAPDLSHIRPDAADRSRPAVGRARIARARPHSDWPEKLLSSPLVSLRDYRGTSRETIRWPAPAPVENWPETALTLPDFFTRIDLLANPDIASDDPYPVEALMALSAGVIPCLPEDYRELFGSAAIYGSSLDLTESIINLKMQPDVMTATHEAGSALLHEVFAPRHFVSRVRDLIGPPAIRAFAPAIHANPPARVLFYSTNGIGMGHLTRQLAIARRLPERLTPVFVSHSRAVETVHSFGFVGEHLPYHTTYGQARTHWNAALTEALSCAIAFYDPRVLIFDGNVPFLGLVACLSDNPDIASVWVRRAMWGPGRDLAALDRAAAFDLVIEPRDPAWPRDFGPTVARERDVRLVPPVRILDRSELPDRQTACAELGLDPDNTNVLIATGSGNNFDLGAITRRVVDRVAGRAGLGLAVAEWKIAQDRMDLPEGVARLSGYPFARSLAAFDLAVAAPGYNTFCEHLAAALPTLWVPNEHNQMDQQIERARHAVERRVGLMVRSTSPFDVDPALTALLDRPTRDAMHTAGAILAAEALAENGAETIAGIVSSLSGSTLGRVKTTEDSPDHDHQMAG